MRKGMAPAEFRRQAEHRLAKMKKAGTGIPAEEVFEYLTRRARGESAIRPKSRRLE